MNSTEFKPCPFCGDKMTDRGGTLQHLDQGKGHKRCPISVYAWPVEDADRWNARAPQTTEWQVKVKPLEWVKDGTYCVAKSIIGTYSVRPCLATYYADQYALTLPGSAKAILYPSGQEAQAAAQADYERRILSTIEPADTGAIQAARSALSDLLAFTMALEKQSSRGTGGRRGGHIFEKARATIERLDRASAKGGDA
ncbi:hypothetical protein [Martelella mangrovi]|uniref:Restriction alleviation protein Lar n=1 Tax=Martelella mangrovi TaxID=1397477 RepID=A0ABV2IFX6_9HYPH